MRYTSNSSFLHTFVKFFIGFVFILIIVVWFIMGSVLYQVYNAAKGTDWSHGVKPVLERVWCGEKGCLDKE